MLCYYEITDKGTVSEENYQGGINMFDNGFFGGLFDIDGDGELSAAERALDFAMFSEMVEECEDYDSEDTDEF